MCGPYLAERIEYIVEEEQDFAFRNLGDIIHALASIISDPCILIGKTGEHRRNDLFQILGNLLLSHRQSSLVQNDIDRCLPSQAQSKLPQDLSIHRFWHEAGVLRKRNRDIAGRLSWLFARARRWRWIRGQFSQFWQSRH